MAWDVSGVCEAFWKLNENAAASDVSDTQGSYDGTAKNDSGAINTNTIDDTGKLNGAFVFNPANDEHVDLGNILSKEYDDAFSVEGWFKTSETSVEQAIIFKTDPDAADGHRGWGVGLQTNGKLQFQLISNPGDDWNNEYMIIKDNDGGLADGSLHHFVITYDGSGNKSGVKIYHDNSECDNYDLGGYDLIGDSNGRTYTVTQNKYGSGYGSATVQIRGSETSFNQDDVLPAWENYSSSVMREWQYIQMRVIKE